MENYGTAINYANTATASSGTAMEKYSAYTDSLEGRLNSLTASFEEFSSTILDSDLVAFFIDITNGAVNALNAVTSFGNGIVTILLIVSAATIAAFTLIGIAATKLKGHLDLLKTSFIDALKNPLTYMTILTSLFIAFQDDMNGTVKFLVGLLAVAATAFSVFCILVKTGAISTAATVSTAIMNIPIFGWIIAIIQAVIIAFTALIGAFDAWIETDAEARESALETAEAMQEEADAMKEVADAAKEATDNVKSLVDELSELQDEGELNASEWLDNIEEIGTEVAKLYPDEHLTSLQAINRLLEEEYTYNDLINMTMQERIDLLSGIESGTRELSAQAARDAYVAQKNASDQLSYALTAYGYDLTNDNETWTWGNLKGNQIKSAISEAEDIASKLSGISMSANAGKDIDIKVDGANITEYVNNLKAAVEEYEERYKYNFGALSENAVYKYLSDSLAQAEQSLSAQQSALKSFVEQATTSYGISLNVEFDEESTKEEAKAAYGSVVDELVSSLRNNPDIAEAIRDGLFGETEKEQEEALREYAQEYIRKYHTELFNAANDMPVIVPLKDAIDILEELEGEFGLLRDAIDEFNESGSVSAETIRSMTDEFPELLRYIKQTENGFEMLGGSMEEILNDYGTLKAQEYADDIAAAYEYYKAVEAAYDGSIESHKIVNDAYQQLKNAVESGRNFITAWNVSTDDMLEEQYKNLLEEQIDALEDQADAYEELCDVRKELLKSYEEERNYVRELEKKQKAVNKLSTKLSVARLDTSAAGQARVRELEAELEEAQEELDDFTLEHAIDVLTKQIDDSNDQYKRLIEDGVSRLENTINGVGQMGAEALKDAISGLGETPIISGGDDSVTGSISGAIDEAVGGVTGGLKDNNAPIEDPKAPEPEETEPVVKPEPKKVLSVNTDYSVSGLSGGLSMGKDDITVTIGDHSYDVKVSSDEESGAVVTALNSLFGNSSKIPDNGRIAYHNGHLYITKKGTWRRLVEEDYEQLKSAYTYLMNNYETHHTGGFVGDVSMLDSNEEFAKLLKGEFVATPTQMHRFMKKTLPDVVNSGSTKNEFNAPLITIECDNVTSEAMPKLQNVVDEAVKEVKKQLDSGMSRVGHKKTAKKLLI